MNVVDVNVLAYLLIPGKSTEAAEQLLEEDPAWVVPRPWRSELRNVLANYLRVNQMDLADAALTFQRATELVGAEEYEVETADVLRLAKKEQVLGLRLRVRCSRRVLGPGVGDSRRQACEGLPPPHALAL